MVVPVPVASLSQQIYLPTGKRNIRELLKRKILPVADIASRYIVLNFWRGADEECLLQWADRGGRTTRADEILRSNGCGWPELWAASLPPGSLYVKQLVRVR